MYYGSTSSQNIFTPFIVFLVRNAMKELFSKIQIIQVYFCLVAWTFNSRAIVIYIAEIVPCCTIQSKDVDSGMRLRIALVSQYLVLQDLFSNKRIKWSHYRMKYI